MPRSPGVYRLAAPIVELRDPPSARRSRRNVYIGTLVGAGIGCPVMARARRADDHQGWSSAVAGRVVYLPPTMLTPIRNELTAAPTVTLTASAGRFAIPAYLFFLWGALSWAAGTAWMLRWDMTLPDALFGGALAAFAANIALLLFAPVLVFVVIPALTAVAVVVQVPVIVVGALSRAIATGFMSGLRSAAARGAVDPPRE